MASIFSRIVAGEIPSYQVADSARYYAFLDINPVVWGHTLVIPKQETDYIFDLSDEELSGLMQFSKQVAKGMEKVIDCERIGVTVIGLEVPHAHVHLMPINHIGDMDFGSGKLSFPPEEMADLATKFKQAIEAL